MQEEIRQKKTLEGLPSTPHVLLGNERNILLY